MGRSRIALCAVMLLFVSGMLGALSSQAALLDPDTGLIYLDYFQQHSLGKTIRYRPVVRFSTDIDKTLLDDVRNAIQQALVAALVQPVAAKLDPESKQDTKGEPRSEPPSLLASFKSKLVSSLAKQISLADVFKILNRRIQFDL